MSTLNPLEFFSSMEISEFKEIFDLFDKDSGGSIDTEELRPLLSTLGKRPTDSELSQLVTEVDTDGSGEIDFDEFLLLLIYLQEDSSTPDESLLRNYFDRIDVESKGFISLEDIESLFTGLSNMGSIFLDPLEKDPDASIIDRAVKWDDYYNRILMGVAHGIKSNENLPQSKTEIDFNKFCELVEMLEM
ncbi:hypothetical protein TrST_g3447 [Triparma strigata]|uniref:Calmodulin n=1 Tax=Triparma strigata TaxID=1606541 RepID=A0A9W7A9M1_9STRA|nr:hypothetical protein TrST_g3447 [Triparma strigata]